MFKFSKMVLVGMVLSTSVQAQTDSVRVFTPVDEFTNTPTAPRIITNNGIHILTGSEGSYSFGMTITPANPVLDTVRVLGMKMREYDRLIISLKGMTCWNDVSMTILFEDGTKYDVWNNTGSNRMHCDGAISLHPMKTTSKLFSVEYYHPLDLDSLNKPIKGIRIVNMNLGVAPTKVLTYMVDETQRSFLMDQIAAIRKWRN